MKSVDYRQKDSHLWLLRQWAGEILRRKFRRSCSWSFSFSLPKRRREGGVAGEERGQGRTNDLVNKRRTFYPREVETLHKSGTKQWINYWQWLEVSDILLKLQSSHIWAKMNSVNIVSLLAKHYQESLTVQALPSLLETNEVTLPQMTVITGLTCLAAQSKAHTHALPSQCRTLEWWSISTNTSHRKSGHRHDSGARKAHNINRGQLFWTNHTAE